MNQPLADLLKRLCSGDAAAEEQIFLEYEPYMRQVVRRHLSASLRSKFDSADVVLSVWADLFRRFRGAGWRFVDADHFRKFLAVATRNRLIDRIRQHREGLTREVPLEEDSSQYVLISPQPSPFEVAHASDLWEWILARCPPEHRPILVLRRQGYSLAEIADRTGLHPDSVRRILRRLAPELASGRPLAVPEVERK